MRQMTLNDRKLDTKKSLDPLTDRYKDASHFHNIDENISIDVKRSLADNSLFLGDRCLLCKASSSEVPINIHMALKQISSDNQILRTLILVTF